eukprot:623526-Prorocentrum_minimum.AAC.1
MPAGGAGRGRFRVGGGGRGRGGAGVGLARARGGSEVLPQGGGEASLLGRGGRAHRVGGRLLHHRQGNVLSALTRLVSPAGIFSLPSRDWSPPQAYSLSPHATGPPRVMEPAALAARAWRGRLALTNTSYC